MSKHFLPEEFAYEDVTMMGTIVKTDILDRLKTFELRSSDIMLITYPKAGTTWLTETVAKLMEDIVGTEGLLRSRMPFIEFAIPNKTPYIDVFEKQEGQRFITTHLMPNFFEKEIYEKKPKAIVLMRNPKDCINSYYHYYQANSALGKFKGTFDEFWKIYEENRIAFGDPIRHIKTWYKFHSEPNFLFITFEDMKLDSESIIRKIATHLEIGLSDDQLKSLVSHTSFDKMSKDEKVNKENLPSSTHDSSISKYIRKGQVGDWMNNFSEEQSKEIDERIEEEITPLGLEFKFTLD